MLILLGGPIASLISAALPYHLTLTVLGHALFTMYW
jgi:hypothetical protein